MVQINPSDNVDIIISAQGISKSFGGIKALNQASIDIHAGRVNAIIGENGAGKSTLMKILAGIYQDYEGQLFFQGEPVSLANTRMAQATGIAIIHQELNLQCLLQIGDSNLNIRYNQHYLFLQLCLTSY